MRKTNFVTGREFALRQGMTLMSTTDASSRITYANSAFVEASGFEANELMGQPHNLVRHPDMPPAAFADMWATLKAGQSWTGVVKNRRKDGDHYWVVANATPMRRHGQLVGYMSVRTPASAAQAQAAQRLYDDMRAGRTRGRALYRGLLVRTGLGRALSFFQLASLRTRLALGVGLGSAAVALPALAQAATPVQQLTVAGTWALGLALGGAFLWRQVATPVDAVLAHANEVASGETAPGPAMNRVDEIGLLMRAVNQAGLNLGALVDDVAVQVDAMASASGQIASGSQDLSGRTEQAAASLQQTAAAMEQIAQTVQNNATTSVEVRKHAESATEAASEGGQAMRRLVAQMDGIQRHGTRIADIANLIDSIAFQTNILALNAAVEAARAGDEGRGFAVVAAEVRALAQRSADAAREVKGLIDESTRDMDQGGHSARQAGETIERIVQQVRRVSALVSDITDASEQQGVGVQQVHVALSQLDGATQQNAALVEQSTAAAGALNVQAARLAEAVGIYKLAR